MWYDGITDHETAEEKAFLERKTAENPMYPIRDMGDEQIKRALLDVARSGDKQAIRENWILYYLYFGVAPA